MKYPKILMYILSVATIILVVRVISVINKNTSAPQEIHNKYKKTRRQLLNEYKTKEKEVILDHTRNRYRASGKTVYDRIFNKKDQTIMELIDNIPYSCIK